MMRKTALCLAMLLTAAAGMAQTAETLQRKERCAALIWGVSDYNRNDDRLATPVNDARALAERLRQLGFMMVKVVENPTLAQQNASLYQFCIEAKTCDVALFFYAGHGVVSENDYDMMENYLLPRDWAHCCVPGTSLPLNRVAKALDNIENCQTKLMFIDACRTRISEDFLFSQRLPKMYDNIWYLFSTADGERAADGNGHSPFMQAMLQQLEVPNLKIDQFLAGLRDRLDSLQPPKFNLSGKGAFVFYPDESAQTDQHLFIVDGTTLQYCNKAVKGAVTLPAAITAIGDRAFKDCSGLTSITLPSSVKSIGDYAFEDCAALTDILLPDSLASIGLYAFSGCEALTEIAIPSAAAAISPGAFTGIKNVHYRGTAAGAPWGALAVNGYWEGGLLYADASKSILEGCTNTAATIHIPRSVTAIDEYAFAWCSGITAIIIPSSVRSIGNNAFLGCSALGSITLPNSVKTIGDEAFWGCTALRSITLPNSVEEIGNDLFWGCKALTSATLSNSLKAIGDGDFLGCDSLRSIAIPKSVRTIGDKAFAWCSSLGRVTLPNTVESIGDNAFAWCKSLSSVTIPNSAKAIGENAFRLVPNVICSDSIEGMPWGALAVNGYWDGHLLYADKSRRTLKACSHSTAAIVIPNTVTAIGEEAFRSCELLKSVTIPNSVETIGNAAFWGCDALTDIALPNSVTHIGDKAFGLCKNLATVTLPGSVTAIGEDAFRGCESLKIIYLPDDSSERLKQLLPPRLRKLVLVVTGM